MFQASKTRSSRRLRLAFLASVAIVAPVFLFTLSAGGQDGKENKIPREDETACMACHAQEMGDKHVIPIKALKVSSHKNLKCQDCHYTITGAPHTHEMLKTKIDCSLCHADQHDKYSLSIHSHKDQVPGDHPTCTSCHGFGDAHAVKPLSEWSKKEKAEVCTRCHSDLKRMARYGVDTDAVASFNESFHGKAILRFGRNDAATCNSCHRNHDVLAPKNPLSSVNRANGDRLCSQKGCHEGAKVNFAMSGANHLRLKVKESPILFGELAFFRTLIVAKVLMLLAAIALDLRRRVFANPPPKAGRPASFIITIAFTLVGASLIMAMTGKRGADWTALTALGLLGLAYIVYLFNPGRHEHGPNGKPMYPRFNSAQRWQHGLLMGTFTLLILTGLPIRFAYVDWIRNFLEIFGGLAVARIIHRVAAVIMIADWIWHSAYLVQQWKKADWKFKSLTMWPTWKDVKDAFHLTAYYFGLTKHEPQYERFGFLEKFEYFAVYWGMPIMVFSGFVLWFPIFWGNRLPEIGLSFAYVAHSYEGLLAFLVIALWHMYNVHFSPDKFPMAKVFYTGTLTEAEMAREHPLELARLKNLQKES